ncbi:hypothetical protein ACTVZO_36860 [Streptomyces sp. IBSNAI002]|uniref:hypothetical protein n=1 Tax=Streptomyces sp. IBSNAI002 TaxID=3457500 RepID=UPI003FD020D0
MSRIPFRATPARGAAPAPAGARTPRRVLLAVTGLCAVLAVLAVALGSPAGTGSAAPAAPTAVALSGEQRARAEGAARALWGAGVPVTGVERGTDPAAEAVVVTSGQGYTEFSWPDLKPLSGTRSMEVNDGDGDDEDAHAGGGPAEQQRGGEEFMRAHFPWADGARVTSWALGDTGRRVISWRRAVDSVLMPMRLDIVVDRSGTAVSFVAVDEPDPRLAPVEVGEEQATAVAAAARPGVPPGRPVLLAVPVGGGWRPAWSFPGSASGSVTGAATGTATGPAGSPGDATRILVDAGTAALLPPADGP